MQCSESSKGAVETKCYRLTDEELETGWVAFGLQQMESESYINGIPGRNKSSPFTAIDDREAKSALQGRLPLETVYERFRKHGNYRTSWK